MNSLAAAATSLPGINVVGHLRSSTGLGNTARLFIEVLKKRGYPVAGFDVEPYLPDEMGDQLGVELVGRVADLPYDFNLIVVSIDRLPQLWLRHARGLSAPRFRNAGMLFWELAVVPRAWEPSLAMFDVVVCCSHYIRQAFENALPDIPTVFAEHPLQLGAVDTDVFANRRRFGIPVGATVYCCSFDLRSGMGRKNPMAALDAWTRAFPDDPNVCLVVKLNGNLADSQDSPGTREIAARAAGDPRILLLSVRLSHHDLMGLFNCCDVFVSLHRSEGLGLIPMEAMALGKVVVATGYSGNMTFMTQQNSMPIAYRLIAPERDRLFFSRSFCGPTAAWAETDIDQAAAALKSCHSDPSLRLKLGDQARRDIDARQVVAWAGDYFDEMISYLKDAERLPRRGVAWLKFRILINEIFNTTLRSKNISNLRGSKVWFRR